jgi:hydrogenase expression/formation protein HypC
MCLAVAGKISETVGHGIERRAVVQVGSESREVSLAMVPEAEVGHWVVFHSGYALRSLSEDEAVAYFEALPPEA